MIDRVATALQEGRPASLLACTLAELIETAQAVAIDPRELRVVGIVHPVEPQEPRLRGRGGRAGRAR